MSELKWLVVTLAGVLSWLLFGYINQYNKMKNPYSDYGAILMGVGFGLLWLLFAFIGDAG